MTKMNAMNIKYPSLKRTRKGMDTMNMYWEAINKETWNHMKNNPCSLEEKSHPVIYFDMDGTLTIFNKNATMEEVFSPGYFKHLDPHKEMIWLAKKLYDQGFDVCILSKSSYESIIEKYEWLQKYMPFIKKENIFFVPLDADKCNFVPKIKSTDVLIDDYWKNLTEDKWNGVAIKCVTNINTKDPTLPWVELDSTPSKNLKMITWAMIRNFAIEAQKGHIDTYAIRFIKEHCQLSEEEFYSICEGFGINTAIYGDYRRGHKENDISGRYIDIFKDYDTFRNIVLKGSFLESSVQKEENDFDR